MLSTMRCDALRARQPVRPLRIYSSRHANTNGCSRNIDVRAINIFRDLNHKLNPQTNPPANSCFRSVLIRFLSISLSFSTSISTSVRRMRYHTFPVTLPRFLTVRGRLKRGSLSAERKERRCSRRPRPSERSAKSRPTKRRKRDHVDPTRCTRVRDALLTSHRETHRRAFNGQPTWRHGYLVPGTRPSVTL